MKEVAVLTKMIEDNLTCVVGLRVEIASIENDLTDSEEGWNLLCGADSYRHHRDHRAEGTEYFRSTHLGSQSYQTRQSSGWGEHVSRFASTLQYQHDTVRHILMTHNRTGSRRAISIQQ